MARANCHHIPGQVWHITRRCHKREFLLKFARDRRRWLQRLFEAKKRYQLAILNYVVTSNHHMVLHVDQPLAESWSTQEVVARWHQLFGGTILSERYLRGDELLEVEQTQLVGLVEIETAKPWSGLVSHARNKTLFPRIEMAPSPDLALSAEPRAKAGAWMGVGSSGPASLCMT